MPEQRTISIGPLVGLVGGVLLFVSLFLSWWEGDVTAFTAFEVLDLLLALLALGAVVALADPLGLRLPGGSPTRARLALPLGAAALVIIFTQLINDPPAIVGSDRGPEIGLWLGLAGALLVVAGGLLAVARISLAVDYEQRGRRRAAAEPGAAADVPPTRSEAPTTGVEAVDPDAPPPPGGPERRT